MENWFTSKKLPLGEWMKVVIEFIQTYFATVIDGIAIGLRFLIEGLTTLLLLPSPIIMIAAVAIGAGWYHRSAKLGVGIALSLLLILNLGYWTATMETLSLVGFATLVSMAIGVPIGVAAAHRPWLYQTLRPVLDLMQTLPTFVYLIPTLVLFGLGVVPGMISTVIFAIPAPIRLTHLGITSVPKPLIEAGEAFGATKSQLLWKVELPCALPTIMTGVNQCIMLSLSMVVIAALVGAGGLGKPVVRALNTVNIPMGFEAGFAIVLLAIVLDRIAKRRETRS